MPVLMVDSEGGWDRWYHALGALVAADDAGYVNTYATGRHIGTLEVLAWLVSLPDDHLICGYSLGYDYAMWLRDLSVEERRRLRSSGDAWVPVGPYRLNLTGNRLTVSRKNPDGTHTTRQIHDVFKFFQASFLNAIGHDKGGWKVVEPDELAVITQGKEGRADFDLAYASSAECVTYSVNECKVGARLVERLRVAVEEALGEPLRQFFGAGSLAKMLLRKHDVQAYQGDHGYPPATAPDVKRAVMHAYYGGRFESAVFGPVEGPVFEYDITSAYPAQMRKLPCLTHASWVRVGADTRWLDGGTGPMYTSLWRVRWNLPDAQPWGPFPFRLRDGTIIAPRRGEGWYWREEVMAARDLFATIEVTDGYVLVKGCQCRPFDWVPEVYDWRMQRGDKNDGPGIVAKLGLNSLYGACAQSVGHPTFQSFVWAGIITSNTRAALLRAIAVDPDAVFMVATDAVYSTRELPGLESPGLGGWERQQYPDAFVVAPGVALLGGKVKSRGLAKRDFSRVAEPLRAAWAHMGPMATVTATTRRFIGLGAGLMRPDAFCSWEDTTRVMTIGAGSKREHPPVGGLLGWPEPYVTRPAMGDGSMSAAYDRGVVSPEAQAARDTLFEVLDQPDPDVFDVEVML